MENLKQDKKSLNERDVAAFLKQRPDFFRH